MNNICLSFVIKILNDKVPNISLQLNCTDGFKIHPYRAILEQKYKKGFGASVQIWMGGVRVFQWESLTNAILILPNFVSQGSHETT